MLKFFTLKESKDSKRFNDGHFKSVEKKAGSQFGTQAVFKGDFMRKIAPGIQTHDLPT